MNPNANENYYESMENVKSLYNFMAQNSDGDLGQYSRQEPNWARYYVEGKAVHVTQWNDLMWTPMEVAETPYFFFDAPCLNKHLHADFTAKEKQALEVIKELDRQAQECSLRVVTTQQGEDGQKYAVLYSPDSGAFFRVSFDDLDYVNTVTGELMAQVQESEDDSSLADPHDVHVDDGGMIS